MKKEPNSSSHNKSVYSLNSKVNNHFGIILSPYIRNLLAIVIATIIAAWAPQTKADIAADYSADSQVTLGPTSLVTHWQDKVGDNTLYPPVIVNGPLQGITSKTPNGNDGLLFSTLLPTGLFSTDNESVIENSTAFSVAVAFSPTSDGPLLNPYRIISGEMSGSDDDWYLSFSDNSVTFSIGDSSGSLEATAAAGESMVDAWWIAVASWESVGGEARASVRLYGTGGLLVDSDEVTSTTLGLSPRSSDGFAVGASRDVLVGILDGLSVIDLLTPLLGVVPVGSYDGIIAALQIHDEYLTDEEAQIVADAYSARYMTSPMRILVTETSGSGPGSIGMAIEDALEILGDTTISCHSILGGLTIILNEGPLQILEDINGSLINIDCSDLEDPISIENPSGSVFTIEDGGSLILNGIQITGGLTPDVSGDNDALPGAGIYNAGTLLLIGCEVFDNITGSATGTGDGGNGAGLYNIGTADLVGCYFHDNHTGDGVVGGHGAAIYNTGILTVAESTLASNTTGDSLLDAGGSGAGIYNLGQLELINTTITSNLTGNGPTGGDGGGIYNGAGSILDVIHSTIVRNTTGLGDTVRNGRGGGIDNAGTLNLQNTIVALNTSTSQPVDISGPITTQPANNFIGDTTGVTSGLTTNELTGDPLLAPSTPFEGGLGVVAAPLSASSVIDSGAVTGKTPDTDQMGGARILGSLPDLGSIEGAISQVPEIPDPEIITLTEVPYSDEAQGPYYGLNRSAEISSDVQGISDAKVKSSRSGGATFTAKVTLRGIRYNIRGAFESDGSVAVVKVSGKGVLPTFDLQLFQSANGAYHVKGTATLAEADITIDLVKNPFHKRDNVTLKAGAYTGMIPALPEWMENTPKGAGYFATLIRPDGKIKILGALGDGTKLSTKSNLTQDGTWILYRDLYKTKPKGFIAGTLAFRELPTISDFDGVLQWRKDADARSKKYAGGFNLMPISIGSIYIPPPKGRRGLDSLDNVDQNALVIFDGADLPVDKVIYEPTWSAYNKIETPDRNLKAKMTVKNGLIKGNLGKGRERVKFSGAAFQKQETALGCFETGSENGTIIITPRVPE